MWATAAAIVAVVVIAIIVVVVAFAGGDGDGDGDDEIAQASPTAEEPAGEVSPTGGDDGDDGDGEDGRDGGDGGDGDGAREGALADLEALASRAVEGVTAKVTYRVTSEVGGEVNDAEWVLVQRPPDSRIEFAATIDSVEIRSIFIIAAGESYICVSGGGQETCFATEAAATEAQTVLLDPLFDVPREVSEGVSDVSIVNRSQRTIAGVEATCFTVSGGLIALGEGEICFADDGLLLLLRSETNGDRVTFEAMSVSTDVTDTDFEPPYEIFALPDFEDFEIRSP